MKSELRQKNVSKATLAATAAREAKRAKVTAEASSVAAPVDSGTDPPPAGHFCRSCRPPHRIGAVGTATAAAPAAPDGAMETGGGRATVRLPTPPAGKPRARAAALSLPMCAPIRTARTHNLHPTALWGRLLRRPLLHRSSPLRRPRSSLPRRSGRCLPAAAPTRRLRTRPLDRCIDPATAAVRRFRNDCESQRC
jgi:hypothetical protein